MTLFTPEDLLLYLYKESSPELTAAIETALKEDWTLREKMLDLQSSTDQLEKSSFLPDGNYPECFELCKGNSRRISCSPSLTCISNTIPYFRGLSLMR